MPWLVNNFSSSIEAAIKRPETTKWVVPSVLILAITLTAYQVRYHCIRKWIDAPRAADKNAMFTMRILLADKSNCILCNVVRCKQGCQKLSVMWLNIWVAWISRIKCKRSWWVAVKRSKKSLLSNGRSRKTDSQMQKSRQSTSTTDFKETSNNQNVRMENFQLTLAPTKNRRVNSSSGENDSCFYPRLDLKWTVSSLNDDEVGSLSQLCF